MKRINRCPLSSLLRAAFPLLMVGLAILLARATVRAGGGAPTVSIMATTSGTEGTSVTVTVTLINAPPDKTVSVHYKTVDGSATSPADYAHTEGDLMWAPGNMDLKSITVPIASDGIAEGEETFTISLSAELNAGVGTRTCTVTINDMGGGGGESTVQFAAASYSTSESANTTLIAVTLTPASTQTVTVTYTVADGTATGNADYKAIPPGTLTFAPGETSQSFSVTIIQDSDFEGNETVELSLTNPINATLGTPSSATLTITNDDVPPPNVSLTSEKPAICAGAKNSAPHQTMLTAQLIDPTTWQPLLQSGVTITFSTTTGTLSETSVSTDADGKASTTLTSSNQASEASVLFKATVTAQASPNSGTVDVEFQPPLPVLTAVPLEIELGAVSALTLSLTWNAYPIPAHALGWRISRVWDSGDVLVYDGVGTPPDNFGTIEPVPSSATDEFGYGIANFRGTAPGKVEIEVADNDVVLVATGDKPKAKEKVKTKAPMPGDLVDIYNSQNGDKVLDDKETTVGAFTIANANDTNGDGIQDYSQDKVEATNKGRNEVDLMRLMVHKQVSDGDKKIKIIWVSGDIKFFEKSTKGKEITDLEYLPATYPNGRVLWVEAQAYSSCPGST